MNAQQILDSIKNKTFSGFIMPNHANCEIILSPRKLVIKIPNQENVEMTYDQGYNPTLLKQGAYEKNSELTDDSIVRGQYLFRDPRYCLCISKRFKEIAPNTYSMVVWQEAVPLIGKVKIKMQIEIISENKFIMSTKSFVRGKELAGQTSTVEFTC